MSSYLRTMKWISYACTLVCALLLPWNFLVPPFLVLLTLSWLMEGEWKEKWANIRSSPVMWLFIILAVLYVAGYFWSANTAEAANSIVVKLALFVMPVVFAGKRYDYIQTKRILQAFL